MGYLRRMLETLAAAAAFAEHGEWRTAEELLEESRRPERRAKTQRPDRRPRLQVS